jgi:hypothetical protein
MPQVGNDCVCIWFVSPFFAWQLMPASFLLVAQFQVPCRREIALSSKMVLVGLFVTLTPALKGSANNSAFYCNF